MMGPAPTVESAHSMVDKAQGTEVKAAEVTTATATPSGTATVTPPRRPGHRGADVRDTVAEMAARAQEISLEAGSKIAAAMKDVIGAAAAVDAQVEPLTAAREERPLPARVVALMGIANVDRGVGGVHDEQEGRADVRPRRARSAAVARGVVARAAVSG